MYRCLDILTYPSMFRYIGVIVRDFDIGLTIDDGEYWVGVRPAEAALADQVLVIPQKQRPLRHLIAITDWQQQQHELTRATATSSTSNWQQQQQNQPHQLAAATATSMASIDSSNSKINRIHWQQQQNISNINRQQQDESMQTSTDSTINSNVHWLQQQQHE